MWNDADVRHDVEQEVGWELPAGLKQISVAVKGGAVELGGHVDTYWEKCAAEDAAWRVVHVNQVTNTIRVDLPFAQQKEDDDIALAAMTILEWNGLVPDTVEVQVAGGVVTLSGSVQRHRQRLEAARALAVLTGVVEVRNHIALEPGPFTADAKTAIDAALKRSALVDSSHFKTHAANGAVSLRGAVRSRAEYLEAMRAAWAAPGVGSVEDHVAIGVTKRD